MSASGKSLEWLLEKKLDPEDLAWDHAMEISASVYRRMEELGLKSKDLADLMGVTPGRISRILSGEQSMTLKTLARLESALGINMAEGFKHPKNEKRDTPNACKIIQYAAIEPSSKGNWLDEMPREM
jgi:transcriptional regulator with XRE-family HTH domain